MSDCIVYYAPEIFIIAVIVILAFAALVAGRHIKKEHNQTAEFECIEELSI